MSKTTTTPTSRASLCALGEYLRRHCVFAPLGEQVTIPQKTVKHRPFEKILDGLLGILCGAKTISQSNGTIRLDPAVQRAFGRTGCAEQSTIARTLQASTPETVDRLSRVSWYYLKRYGQTPHHRFAERRLWVDVDVTPLPIGAQAEGSERTWMGRNRSKTGRKTLRITASRSREILHRNVTPGERNCRTSLGSRSPGGRKPSGVDAGAAGADYLAPRRGLWHDRGAQLAPQSGLSGGGQDQP